MEDGIENEVEVMRGEILILTKIKRNNNPNTRKARTVVQKYKIPNTNDIPNIKEQHKQKMQVKAQRLRSFDK